MFGTEVTYLLGSEASANFWGSHNDHLNAEDLYANITVPYEQRAAVLMLAPSLGRDTRGCISHNVMFYFS